ncbi:hypothetical protein QAD02_000710 [Eretmocerus hayati]|uniref:Uncharacterized protein n=1 Tax=Eretmocerus hayati TaxID=131215 RepID=A0ACC2NEY7_9HYME|nr:hypothetical protein QAD02_000710 [Eretmocerus hayati]
MQNADEAEINFVGDNIQGMRAAPSGQRSVERADSGFGGSSALEDSNDNLGDIDEPLPKRRRFSSDSSDSRDEGEPVNPPGQQELKQDEMTTATAKLRLSVCMAPNNEALHSELLGNLLFIVPADTHSAVTSEVVLEIAPEEARVVVKSHDEGRQILRRSCNVSWAKEVPRRCVDDPELRAVTREILTGTCPAKRPKSPSPRTRSNSI